MTRHRQRPHTPSSVQRPAILSAVLLASLSADAATPPAPRKLAPARAGAPAAALLAPAPCVGAPVTPRELAGHLRFLSDDLLEGRSPGTRGDRLAQGYIEAVFRASSLAPVFGNGYRQEVPIRLAAPDPRTTLTFEGASGNASAGRFGDDFVLTFPRPEAAGVVRAGVVFAGYGIEAKEYGWDDFKGVDVKGKVLLVLAGEPGGDDPALFGGKALTRHGRWRTKLEVAGRRGAAGVLFVHSREGAGYGWEVVRNGWTRPVASDPSNTPLSLEGWITEAVATRVATAAGESLAELRGAASRADFRPRALPIRADAAAVAKYDTVASANVAGIVRGSGGPSAPVVVVSAHHDHLGLGTTENGDGIYNGAMDNGSALSILLALARRIGARAGTLPVDVLFVAPAAEEAGLLGSERFVANPPVPLARMAACLNLEMSAVWGPARDLVAIGAGESALADAIGAVAAREGLRMAPEPAPEQGFFFRSDQFAFAKAGVPATWIDLGDDLVDTAPGTGLARREEYRARRYHRPGDAFDPKWELTGTAQLARIVELVVEEIAARGGKVPWKAGSPFAR